MRYDDQATLLDIAKAAQLVVKFTNDMTRSQFLANELVQSATMHQLMVVGEAVKRLSPEFRAVNNYVPWKEIAGMRDRLIHGYDLVDLKQVWKTARSDAPALLAELASHLPPTT